MLFSFLSKVIHIPIVEKSSFNQYLMCGIHALKRRCTKYWYGIVRVIFRCAQLRPYYTIAGNLLVCRVWLRKQVTVVAVSNIWQACALLQWHI